VTTVGLGIETCARFTVNRMNVVLVSCAGKTRWCLSSSGEREKNDRVQGGDFGSLDLVMRQFGKGIGTPLHIPAALH
jgi:hypothetical protein